ncbi:glycoside hydrolase family 2 protein [Aaosphaeria arxii CBS 175.79]|uniref:Beta-mannosidase B n=1 Tax=Aaosphaeria arxii CBS 175.79 TaxID=1450172 RepID=A0A6A5X9S4_9PLEO|nr:glycoside hydrolase family 2 protein [Aaosphaeria arxii CBS 175.79]KAF2009712.1 glycoside hydrolase family 2 protein [Aaosphaeria arxii CBS 175.79]
MSVVPVSSISLAKGWSFKRGDRSSNGEFLPAGDLPTEVHRDLLKHGKIEDPFQNLNELSVRWVAEEAWTYRLSFSPPKGYAHDGSKTVLRFEGLDTFASVYLNGSLILESDNMFVENTVDVTGKLKSDNNVLELTFDSARLRGLDLVEKYKDQHRFIVHQTEVSRGPVRKAQYAWGWDWGPILLTAGPWKPIWLETYTAKIEDVWVEYDLDKDLKRASGTLHAQVDGPGSKVIFEIREKSADKLVGKYETVVKNGTASVPFIAQISLWWPRTYGAQNLYTIKATLVSSESTPQVDLCSVSKTIGFRKTELIQEKDKRGTSFYFRINDVDIFAGGSCWIPADSFLTSISPERYRDWVQLAAEGNQSMIRVWGGGIYEPDSFYDACDEFGVLVWEDFMFACANYPAYPEYLSSVELEARQNVRRLRSHPSIVIWAGNNEDYQIVERYGLEYHFTEDKDPQSWLKTDFPARYIYEHLLPKVIQEESKNVPYHPSSPFGNGTSTTLKVDPTVGDIHQWNVWHGEMKPYQKLGSMGGRFVSEFGMEAYPHLETLEKNVTQDVDRVPGSMAMDFRNKAIGHERRLVSYVAENFRIKYSVEDFTHLTQVMQADAMSWAYKSWRRQWGTKGSRDCGGVLVWQLNDCWPTMSWAIVDYYLVPKPAYYAIKRAMEPITIGVTRKFNDWTMRPADALWKRDTSHIDMRLIWENVEFNVWVASSSGDEAKATVEVKFLSIRDGKEVEPAINLDITIQGNGTTEVIQERKVEKSNGQDPRKPFEPSKADPFIIYAVLSINGKEVATDVSWPDPIKYIQFPPREPQIRYSEDKSTIFISAVTPIKGFVFSELQGTKLSDNGFDLIPGVTKTITVSGVPADRLKWAYI